MSTTITISKSHLQIGIPPSHRVH